jgi:hypothetical protein
MQRTQSHRNDENHPLYSRPHIQIHRQHLYLQGDGAIRGMDWVRGKT